MLASIRRFRRKMGFAPHRPKCGREIPQNLAKKCEMQRYNFIRRESARTYSEAEINKAAIVSNVAEILELSANPDKYEFAVNDELTKAFAACKGISVVVDTLNSGKEINKAAADLNGKTLNLRVWNGRGKDCLLAPQNLDAKTCKTLKFGYCKQSGEMVTETKVNPTTGELKRFPVVYVDLSQFA